MYVAEYHQKVYGADTAGREWASSGMQRLYAPFMVIIARDMELTDEDIVNYHTALLAQLCNPYSVSCLMLTDNVANQGFRILLIVNIVNKVLYIASASPKHPGSKEQAPPALLGRKEAKNLLIRMLYLGNPDYWSKEVGYKGSIPKFEELRVELKRIENAIVKHFPVLHHDVLVVAHDTDVFAKKNTF